jgi:Cu2+-exporting ATPase/Cu+-exporting ATPase
MTDLAGCACFGDEKTPDSGGVWWRIGGGAFLAMNAMVMSLAVNGSEVTASEKQALELAVLAISGSVFLLLGGGFAVSAWREIRARRITLELFFLAGVAASLAASFLSLQKGVSGSYADVAALLLVIYSLGREIGRYGQRKVLRALEDLGRREQTVRRLDATGRAVSAPLAALHPGDRIRVLPGEVIPLDGRITQGSAYVHEAGITGETFSRPRQAGDPVSAGCCPLDGSLELEVLDTGATSLERLRNAALEGLARPGARQILASRVLSYFAPTVALTAIATYVLQGRDGNALFHALSVVVVACPCALGFATPLAVWSGMARLRELGYLVRSGDALERLGEVDTIVFDKTGTLTLPEQYAANWTPAAPWAGREPLLLALLRETEQASGHPLARAMRPLWSQADLALPECEAIEVRILPGVGVEAIIAERASGARFPVSVRGTPAEGADREIELHVDQQPAALIRLSEVYAGALPELFERLGRLIRRIHLSTGDQAARAQRIPVADRMVCQGPLDKLEFVRGAGAAGSKVLFAGDGLNDAAAMAWSHVGLAAPQAAPAVREIAGLIALTPDWEELPRALAIARATSRCVVRNIGVSLAYNVIGMALAAAGWLHPVTAAVLMMVSSLIVILWSLQLLEQDPRV